MLDESGGPTSRAAIGALLRRGGLYSSRSTLWLYACRVMGWKCKWVRCLMRWMGLWATALGLRASRAHPGYKV